MKHAFLKTKEACQLMNVHRSTLDRNFKDCCFKVGHTLYWDPKKLLAKANGQKKEAPKRGPKES